LLVRLEKPPVGLRTRIKILKRKGTHSVGSAGRPITSKQVRKLLVDFP
jgi:hypothetical protein